MKTAEQYARENLKGLQTFEEMVEVLKSYAREAIKADRENVANYAPYQDFINHNTGEIFEAVLADFIKNAPQIELL